MNKKSASDVPIIRPVKKSDPDLRKLARALIALAIAENNAAKDKKDAGAEGLGEQDFGAAS